MTNMNKLQFELLPHIPHSPDLAPSDYFLLPNLKKLHGDKKFANTKDVQSAIDCYFEKLDVSHYQWGIQTIKRCCEKRIELNGDC